MNRLFLLVAIGGLITALVVGIAVVGGPGHARLQKAETEAAQNFRTVYGWLQCRNEGDVLPQALQDTAYCEGHNGRISELSSEDLARLEYTRESDRRFTLCLTFELERDAFQHNLRQVNMIWEGRKMCQDGQASPKG